MTGSFLRAAPRSMSFISVSINYMARQPLFGAARIPSIAIGDVQVSDVSVLDLREVVAGNKRLKRKLHPLSFRSLTLNPLKLRPLNWAAALAACCPRVTATT